MFTAMALHYRQSLQWELLSEALRCRVQPWPDHQRQVVTLLKLMISEPVDCVYFLSVGQQHNNNNNNNNNKNNSVSCMRLKDLTTIGL